jgi:PHD/YefM family antitoxin component YafN of YafNO toxin-antitoxin module
MSNSDEKLPPLSEFKQNLNEVLELLNQPNIPIIVSHDGEAQAVVSGAASHQDLLDAIQGNDTVDGIREGLAGLDSGDGRPADAAIRSILKGR